MAIMMSGCNPEVLSSWPAACQEVVDNLHKLHFIYSTLGAMSTVQ